MVAAVVVDTHSRPLSTGPLLTARRSNDQFMRGARVRLRFLRRFLLSAFSRRYRAPHPEGALALTDLPSVPPPSC